MARVTIQKCLKHSITDKFDLVLIAARRANDLEKGKKPFVNDKAKNTLVSLKEIEEDKLDVDSIRREIIKKYRKYGVSQNSDNQEKTECENLSNKLNNIDNCDHDNSEDNLLSEEDIDVDVDEDEDTEEAFETIESDEIDNDTEEDA